MSQDVFKIIQPPMLPTGLDWREMLRNRANSARVYTGKAGVLMASHGKCALLNLDTLKVTPLLELRRFNNIVEDVFQFKSQDRTYEGVESADTLDEGCKAYYESTVDGYRSSDIIVKVLDKTEFGLDGKVSVAYPNNLNLTLIMMAVNNELGVVKNGIPSFGTMETTGVSAWENTPYPQDYLGEESLRIAQIYLICEYRRNTIEAHADALTPSFVAFTQGEVGKTLKMEVNFHHYVSSATYTDPYKDNVKRKLPLSCYLDWEFQFAPVKGEWQNNWTLPLELGEWVTISSGSRLINAEKGDENVAISVQIPTSRIGAFRLIPKFQSGRNYIPTTVGNWFTNLAVGMTETQYLAILRQRYTYSVNLYADLNLTTARFV